MIDRTGSRLFAGLLLVFIAGCDTTPGPADLAGKAPVVSNLSFTPDNILVDTLPDGVVVDGIARFDVTVSVDANDADGDLDRVFIVVLSPIVTDVALSQTTIEAPGNGALQATITLAIPVSDVGLYAIKVTASDTAGRLSNQVIGQLEFDATGGPPVIEEIDIPDRITRPAPGEPGIQVPIVATVSDPDGLDNVLRVEVSVNGAVTLQLCDDGSSGVCNSGFGASGDSVSGDGKFTLTIQLDATNGAGVNTFVFTAIDRSGLQSSSETRTITVD